MHSWAPCTHMQHRHCRTQGHVCGCTAVWQGLGGSQHPATTDSTLVRLYQRACILGAGLK